MGEVDVGCCDYMDSVIRLEIDCECERRTEKRVDNVVLRMPMIAHRIDQGAIESFVRGVESHSPMC